jgi:hypothetical protein
MKSFDMSFVPSNPEEMPAYAELWKKELTKNVEENGISEVISLLATTTASTMYFAKGQQQISKRANDNFEQLLDIVRDLMETMRVISRRLEDLEGN